VVVAHHYHRRKQIRNRVVIAIARSSIHRCE
jgi:hypothetical protein